MDFNIKMPKLSRLQQLGVVAAVAVGLGVAWYAKGQYDEYLASQKETDARAEYKKEVATKTQASRRATAEAQEAWTGRASTTYVSPGLPAPVSTQSGAKASTPPKPANIRLQGVESFGSVRMPSWDYGSLEG